MAQTFTQEQTDIIDIAHHCFGSIIVRNDSADLQVANGLADEGYLCADDIDFERVIFRMTPKGKRLGGRLFGQVSIRGFHRR
jgi:hypothetical protein